MPATPTDLTPITAKQAGPARGAPPMGTTATADQASDRRPSRTWVPIKRRRAHPTIVAWIEVFWAPALGRYVTIPGASRCHHGPERPE